MQKKQIPNLIFPGVTLSLLVGLILVSFYGCDISNLQPNPPRARLEIHSNRVNQAGASSSTTVPKSNRGMRDGTTLPQRTVRRPSDTTLPGRSGTTLPSRSGTTLPGRSGTTLPGRSSTTLPGR